jgi:hypothetical protein
MTKMKTTTALNGKPTGELSMMDVVDLATTVTASDAEWRKRPEYKAIKQFLNPPEQKAIRYKRWSIVPVIRPEGWLYEIIQPDGRSSGFFTSSVKDAKAEINQLSKHKEETKDRN